MSILTDYSYHTIDDPDKLRAWLRELQSSDLIIGLDTETDRLKYDNQLVESVQIAGNKKVVFIPLAGDVLRQLDLTMTLQEYIPKFTTIAMHNAPFDLAALHRIGVEYEGNAFCTMTALHLVNETYPKGLKETAATIFKVPITTYEQVQNLPRTSQEFIRYASHDAIFCRELYPMLVDSLKKKGMWRLASIIEMPFQHVLKDMRIAGLPVGIAEAEAMKAQAEVLTYDLMKKCHDSAGLKYQEQCDLLGERFIASKWNLNSSEQLVRILEGTLGLEITELTESGAKSVGKKTKERLKNRNPFVKLLVQYGQVSKLLNGFLMPFKDYIDSDGRMRSDWNNTGTVTGRPSSSKPNLLNLPKDNEELGLNFRSCFVAPEGKMLTALDFGGQELRVLADISQDPKLAEVFSKGLDIHLAVANEMFHLGIPDAALSEKHPDYETFKSQFKKQRHVAKNGVVYPLLYGSTAVGIADTLNIDTETAQGYIDQFFSAYPSVKQLIDATRRFIMANGYAVNKSGRRRHFDKEYGKYGNGCFRQGFNFLIQGVSADMTKICCVNLRREFRKHPEWEATILMEVYDEIVIEHSEKYCTEVAQIARKIMCSSYKLSVPLEVSIGSGKNYSECK